MGVQIPFGGFPATGIASKYCKDFIFFAVIFYALFLHVIFNLSVIKFNCVLAICKHDIIITLLCLRNIK